VAHLPILIPLRPLFLKIGLIIILRRFDRNGFSVKILKFLAVIGIVGVGRSVNLTVPRRIFITLLRGEVVLRFNRPYLPMTGGRMDVVEVVAVSHTGRTVGSAGTVGAG
jgi:hypothetical protein